MNRFSRVSALWASFYSRDLYREVGSRWKGIGLVYLMLLLGLCWLPSAARWFLGLREFATTEARDIVKQLPAILIKDGVMTASPAGRHVVRLGDASNPDEGQLIIDDSIDIVPTEAAGDTFVLTRREAGTIRPSRNERRVWTLTPAADMDVTPEEVGGFLHSLAFWVPPVVYVGAVAGSLVFRLLIWFGPWEPEWYVRWPIALLMTLGYIAFGVRAVATSSSDMVDAG